VEGAFFSEDGGNLEALVLRFFKDFRAMKTEEGFSCILASCG
jgi:hypothetical protein